MQIYLRLLFRCGTNMRLSTAHRDPNRLTARIEVKYTEFAFKTGLGDDE